MPDTARCLPILAAAIAVAGPGCASGGSELDVAGATAKIERELASRFEIRVKSLECPAEVIVEDGADFSCTATAQGGRKYDVAVELIGTDGGFTFSKPKLIRNG